MPIEPKPRKPRRLQPSMLAKRAEEFRQYLLWYVQKGDPQTLKRAAHQIADLYDANHDYRDAQWLKTLLRFVEFVIQDVTGSKWTVARSRRDGRGRVATHRGRKDYVRHNPRLGRAITQTLIGDVDD